MGLFANTSWQQKYDSKSKCFTQITLLIFFIPYPDRQLKEMGYDLPFHLHGKTPEVGPTLQLPKYNGGRGL